MPPKCFSNLFAKLRLLTLLTFLILGFTTPLRAQRPRTVIVRGLDYAFQSPDTLPAGHTSFVLDNRGTVRHELVLARLKRGHTLAEVMAAKTSAERQPLYDGLVGLILAEPGTRALGSLATNLTKGRIYVLICNLRDSPDKQPHLAQGMGRILYVR